MPGVLLTILQIVGIVFACIGGFIGFAAVCPFRYSVEASYHGEAQDKARARVRANWLLWLVRIFVDYENEKPRVLVKVLFFTVFDSDNKKKKKKKKNKKSKRNKNRKKGSGNRSLVRKKDEKEELFEVSEDDENKDPEDMSLKDKFISVMDKIVNFLKTARDKIGAAAVWLDPEHRRLIAFLWTNGLKIFKKVRPKHFEVEAYGGTGDPYYTGLIVSILSVILGFSGIDTVYFEPDFEEKRLDLDVSANGYFFVFPIIFIALKIYTNKDFKRFILKKAV